MKKTEKKKKKKKDNRNCYVQFGLVLLIDFQCVFLPIYLVLEYYY